MGYTSQMHMGLCICWLWLAEVEDPQAQGKVSWGHLVVVSVFVSRHYDLQLGGGERLPEIYVVPWFVFARTVLTYSRPGDRLCEAEPAFVLQLASPDGRSNDLVDCNVMKAYVADV